MIICDPDTCVCLLSLLIICDPDTCVSLLSVLIICDPDTCVSLLSLFIICDPDTCVCLLSLLIICDPGTWADIFFFPAFFMILNDTGLDKSFKSVSRTNPHSVSGLRGAIRNLLASTAYFS